MAEGEHVPAKVARRRHRIATDETAREKSAGRRSSMTSGTFAGSVGMCAAVVLGVGTRMIPSTRCSAMNLQVLCLERSVIVGIAEHDRHAGGLRRVLNPARHRVEERIQHVRVDEGKQSAA